MVALWLTVTTGLFELLPEAVAQKVSATHEATASKALSRPATPSGLTAVGFAGGFDLSWTDPGDDSITEYHFRVRGFEEVDWRPWRVIAKSGASTTGNRFRGLAEGWDYFVQLRAVNAAGAGQPSEIRVLTMVLSASSPQPLLDPLPERIVQGEIAVDAVEFLHAPPTFSPAKPKSRDLGYALLQYLLPLPDGSGRLAFNDLRGLLYVTDRHGMTPSVYLDLRDQDLGFDFDTGATRETGLMSFAFHPEFGDRDKPGYGKLYTAFSAQRDSDIADYSGEITGSRDNVILEWTASQPRANVFSGAWREVLRIGRPTVLHNIGTIAFNPTATVGSPDYGLLYVSLGDGGIWVSVHDYAQDLRVPFGAILRIDPFGGDGERGYGIPVDNPFVAEAGVAGEIWAYGFRHPQQFSWDVDGRMFISDIGSNFIEEISLGQAGGNYGWGLREGAFATRLAYEDSPVKFSSVFPLPRRDAQPFVYPVAQYDHDEGNAVSGGFVYRGQGIPALQGKYVFSDIVRGRVFYIATDKLRAGNPAPIKELRLRFDGRERGLLDVAGRRVGVRDRVDLRLGVDEVGELYLLTKSDGWIRKLKSPPE